MEKAVMVGNSSMMSNTFEDRGQCTFTYTQGQYNAMTIQQKEALSLLECEVIIEPIVKKDVSNVGVFICLILILGLMFFFIDSYNKDTGN